MAGTVNQIRNGSSSGSGLARAVSAAVLGLVCLSLAACVPDVKNAAKGLDFLGGPPGAPVSVNAAAGNMEVILSWLPPTTGSSAESYNIYQTTTPPILTHAQGGPVATRMTSSLNFPDLALTNGTTYTYVVTGVDALGEEGSPSSPVSQTPSALLSSAPTLTSIVAGDRQITLNWTDVPDIGDVTVTFNIYRAATAGGETIPGPTVYSGIVNGTTSKLDTGLSPGTQYFYKVTSAKGGSEVPSTNELHAYTFADPPAPITATPSATQIDLSWSAVTGAQSYNVYSAVHLGTLTLTTNVASPAASLTGLLSSTGYDYQIATVNPDGVEGIRSTVATATTLVAGPMPPGAPTGLTPTTGPGQITLDWTAPTTGGAPTGYNVYDVTGTRTLLSSVGASTFQFIVTGLINGVSHSYVVTAFNADGEGPDSTVGPVTSTSVATPPSSPVIANVRSGGTIFSGFMTGTVDAGSLPATVEASVDGGAFAPVTTGSSVAASATGSAWKLQLPHGVSAWRINTSHTVVVRTHDSDGNAPSVSITFKQGRNQDINGDGVSEIAIVDRGLSRVYVFNGVAPGGIPNAAASTLLSAAFGYSAVIGDVNGDGYADVVVGDAASAQVKVFLTLSGSLGAGGTLLLSGAAGLDFGFAVALGDFNGDGIDDVVVGDDFGDASGTANGFGSIFVFPSASGTGPSSTASFSMSGPAINPSHFGSTIATGDIDGDGREDLVVGAYGAQVATAFFAPTFTATRNLTGANQFGATVAVGDVDGDGQADIVVGDPLASPSSQVSLFLASSSASTEASPDAGTTSPFNGYGAALVVQDVNGDGKADVLVGSPLLSTGAIYLYDSAVFAGSVVNFSSYTAIYSPSTGVSNLFGTAIALADTNGDGALDLVVGQPGTPAVNIFHSSGTGFPGHNVLDASADTTLSGFGGSFGIQVASRDPRGPAVPYRERSSPSQDLWVGPRRRWVLSV